MTGDQKQLVIVAAKSVQAEHDAGRLVDPYRLAWAQHWIREDERTKKVCIRCTQTGHLSHACQNEIWAEK